MGTLDGGSESRIEQLGERGFFAGEHVEGGFSRTPGAGYLFSQLGGVTVFLGNKGDSPAHHRQSQGPAPLVTIDHGVSPLFASLP